MNCDASDPVASNKKATNSTAPTAYDTYSAETPEVEAMWQHVARAQELIPGSTVTMSKAPVRSTQPHTPALIVRGKGCRVWDEAGRCYIDFRNGLGPVTLGYGNERVNAAIKRQLDNGIVFGQPSPLEAELAERLVQLIPCAQQVRYLKTGGEAMAATFRLARAFTQRPVILSCGYHGWVNSVGGYKQGCPPNAAQYHRFLPWGDMTAFETAAAEFGEQQIAAISVAMPYAQITEDHPFYRQIRAFADRIGALLIFDEIVTGFRLRIGGAQEFFGVTPDLAVFSKGVAAGMPLSVFCGRKDIMQHAATIPVSSTFAGDTLSLAAALETVDIYEKDGVIAHIWARGAEMMQGLNDIFARYAFPMQIKGFAPCAAWSVGGENWNAVGQTHSKAAGAIMNAFTDACYAHGVSLYTVVYPNFAHAPEDIAEALERIEQAVAGVVSAGVIERLLQG